MLLSRTSLVAMFALVILGCTTSATETAITVPDPTVQPTEPPPESTPTTEAQPTTAQERLEPETAFSPDSDCVLLTDFTSTEHNARWQTVNDNVMGGQSVGGPQFIDDVLVFSGEINTDGGGFSSLRMPLDPGELDGVDRVVIRAQTDGRPYMVTFDDELPKRDRRVTHRAPIVFQDDEGWQVATVMFADLFPFVFGQRVDDLPFRPDLASRMGLMISDGIDGRFELQVDQILLCRPEI